MRLAINGILQTIITASQSKLAFPNELKKKNKKPHETWIVCDLKPGGGGRKMRNLPSKEKKKKNKKEKGKKKKSPTLNTPEINVGKHNSTQQTFYQGTPHLTKIAW